MRRLAVLLAVVLLPAFPTLPAGAAGAADLAAGPTAPAVTVMLVTGDRVTLRSTPDGRPAVSIEPAKRSANRVDFRTTYTNGTVRVVPSDVARLVPDVLDPELFNVTGLARAGYRDGEPLPLIVRGPAALATMDDRLRAVRSLPSIGATAVQLATDGQSLGAASVLTGATRVWLDGRAHQAGPPLWAAERDIQQPPARQPATQRPGGGLDSNLVQIGAPPAWAAGLSGTGTTVAVLDTGVDAGHPDLAGRVALAQNFTDSPVVTDRNGHGTHVASLLAGSGAASGGARRGVAFGATLLSGKVLDDAGTGQFSGIIAGMEWAAANGARVVNLSLGSDSPSTGRDPLSLAVNALTASHGVLFVASSGNRGPAPTTVGAPGAADAALTVGAVDGRDRLADFSGRGPRLGDFAIKPDLVAPGVGIVAARAAGTDLGEPVDARYTRLSGTSMAAPHVAGAAALLAERHPQWAPEMLKSALIGSAAAVDAGAFDAGSGRVDLVNAVPRQVLAEPAAAGFGFAGYPQADLPPMLRDVRFVNTGAAPASLDLTARLNAPDGRTAPAGMLTVTPQRLMIPAGAAASATVRLAVASGGSGAYSGAVTASRAGGPAVRVPVGVVKESTRHLLHLRAVDRSGTSQVETLATVINQTDITASPPDPVLLTNGEATVRVPPGFYTITAAIPTLVEGEPPPDSIAAAELVIGSVAVATVTDVPVDHDREVVLDARQAQPISASVTGVATTPVDVRMFVAARDRAGNGFVLGYDTSAQDVIDGKLFVQPTTPVRHGMVELSTKWRLDSTAGTTYDLLFAGPGLPASLAYTVDTQRLARVETTYRAPVAPAGYRELRQVFTDLNPVSVAVAQPVPGIAPLVRTEYLSDGTDQRWFQCATLTVSEAGIGNFCQAPTRYHGPSTVNLAWLRAPLRSTAAALRTATSLQIGMDDLAESGPNSGSIASHTLAQRSYTLHRNGVLLAEGTDPLGTHPVPAGAARFRLTRTVASDPGLFPLSRLVETSWTFTSIPPRAGQPATAAPIVDVAVHVPVDPANRVPANVSVPVELEVRQTGGRIASVVLQVSTDDGRTWTAVPLRRSGEDRYRTAIVAGPGPVSLRTTAADTAGNGTVQTIIGAVIAG